MEKITVNRLPAITYRYLRVNDSPYEFKSPETAAEVLFSDYAYVTEGGVLPADFKGASEEVLVASGTGRTYTIAIPEKTETELVISIAADELQRDFAGRFIFKLGKDAKLKLLWRLNGNVENSVFVSASFYELADRAAMDVSYLETGFSASSLYEQRHAVLGEAAKIDFTAAELGGEKVIVHSYGKLEGDRSEMNETALYAAVGTQTLDLFYHIDHVGKETHATIDAKGSLSDTAKKVFRGTLDFKRGCSGSVGDEGDYAIQLSPTTKNISLPLLLCSEDDVSGNHASSAGQLDMNTIYFLMTRGFSLEDARLIVVEALICPLIDKLDESIREEVLAVVREKLNAKEK